MENPGADFYQEFYLYADRDDAHRASGRGPDWRFLTCLKLCRADAGPKLLDIGCADGEFLALARTQGFDVFGIDFDERAVQKARRLRQLEHVMTGPCESLKCIEGWTEFDVITLFDVLEHLSSPLGTIVTVRELLKPGGKVCITVPRLDRYPRVFDEAADFPPHHLTLWTAHALAVMLRTAGFDEVRIMEKPLLLQDLWKHLKWPTLRYIRKLKANPRDLIESGHSSSPKPSRVAGLVKKPLRMSLQPLNWVLQAGSLGRGHTLLALGTKPFSGS